MYAEQRCACIHVRCTTHERGNVAVTTSSDPDGGTACAMAPWPSPPQRHGILSLNPRPIHGLISDATPYVDTDPHDPGELSPGDFAAAEDELYDEDFTNGVDETEL